MGGRQSKYVDVDNLSTHQIVYEPNNCSYGVYISMAACATSMCTLICVIGLLVAWYFTHDKHERWW